MIAAGVIAGWAGGLLILIAASVIAIALMAFIYGDVTDENKPPYEDEDE